MTGLRGVTPLRGGPLRLCVCVSVPSRGSGVPSRWRSPYPLQSGHSRCRVRPLQLPDACPPTVAPARSFLPAAAPPLRSAAFPTPSRAVPIQAGARYCGVGLSGCPEPVSTEECREVRTRCRDGSSGLPGQSLPHSLRRSPIKLPRVTL